jgi:isopenicillin N synthase-like dioxygenase
VLTASPKPFFGYSDNTNLHRFLWNLGLVSHLGGSIMVQFGWPVAMTACRWTCRWSTPRGKLMTSAIPVIDLRAATAGDTSHLGAVRAATEELGAIQVINHGVPQDLISDLNARSARLFSLPQAEKAKLASPHPYRGWRQWPDDFGRLELERFNVSQFDDIGAARAAGLGEDYLGLYAHANMWPADDPGLREAAFGYLEASRKLAKRMLWLFGRAEGLREDTFGLGSLPHLQLTVNNYPAWTQPEAAPNEGGTAEGDAAEAGTAEAGTAEAGPAEAGTAEDKLLLVEHTDDSVVTILSQEGDYDGLQIQEPGGRWITVPVIPGALTLFTGSLLTRWTGGRMRAGRQRVVAGGTEPRRSTAVFVYPALEATVGSLAPFAPFAADCHGEPILVWDHVKDRLAGYLAEYGRPEQIAAWREGEPQVGELAETSAGL